jgi:oligoendopeptidase F
MLKGAIDGEEYDALRLHLFENALSTLIFQGFYACFEAIAYSIPRDEITRESLDGAVGDAAEMMGLRRDSLNNINAVLIPHIIIYPFYVQAYTASLAASSEIYFKELDKSGEGIRIYKELLTRDEKRTFEESLASVGLTSPFSEGYLRIIADRIHTELTGSPYFNSGEADDAAA